MIWFYKDGRFTPMDQVPEGPWTPADALPCSSLEACRALLSAEDEQYIETAAAYPEGSAGVAAARQHYMSPKGLDA